MMLDANYTIYDNDGGLVEGEIYILDTVGFSLRQLFDVTKNAKTFLTYTTFLQEAAPVRLICNHIANTSSVIDTVMAIVKPILSEEVAELVQFHKVGSDTMLKFIDKDVLPIDYGGTNGTIDDHYQDWLKVFETKRFVGERRLDCLEFDSFVFFSSSPTETTCSTMTLGE
jgi:CRAL/TRIO domain